MAYLFAVVDEERRELRRRWRREGRPTGRARKRLVVTIGEPPSGRMDPHAAALWGLGAALLIWAESAFDRSITLECNADKVLRAYVRGVRKLLRRTEQAGRKYRPARRRTSRGDS